MSFANTENFSKNIIHTDTVSYMQLYGYGFSVCIMERYFSFSGGMYSSVHLHIQTSILLLNVH
jgi:hypothetical protein